MSGESDGIGNEMQIGEEPVLGGTERVSLSLGANLGDRVASLRQALALIDELPGVRLVAASSFYETEPVGIVDQPEFVNCAALCETTLGPADLLRALRGIELKLGRERRDRWREREIDIDILLYGRHVVSEEGITIPHPEMHRRRFVLEPLAEIAPDELHPTLGLTVRELLHRLEDAARVQKSDPDHK